MPIQYYAVLVSDQKIIPDTQCPNRNDTARIAEHYVNQRVNQYLIMHHIATNHPNFTKILIDLYQNRFAYQIEAKDQGESLTLHG